MDDHEQHVSPELRAWIEQRLEAERKLIFDVLDEAIAKLRLEQRDLELKTEIAKLWTAIVETKTAICELSRERVGQGGKSFRDDPIDWSKVKVN